MTQTIINVVFILALVPGLLMAFIPILPAMLYMFLVALVYAAIVGFGVFTVNNLLILAGLLVLSAIVDLLSGLLGAKFGGASKKSLAYGFLGLLGGFLAFPPFGGLAGLFSGVLISELLHGNSQRNAMRAATGSLIGVLAGIGLNVLLAWTFFVLFIVFVLAL